MSTAHESGAGGYGHGKHKRRKTSRWRFELKKRKKAEPFQPELHGLERRMMPSTYTVQTNADDGPNSLREAIISANGDPGSTIDFNIGTGPQVITLLSALPAITASMTIDGTTQTGYTGAPIIEVVGSSAGSGVSGLALSASGGVVKGLIIDDFAANGILVSGSGWQISNNYIGTDLTGTTAAANRAGGIEISGGSSANTIGGSIAALGNVVSGNGGNGIEITGAGTDDNLVENNALGVNAARTAALGNASDGISVDTGASSNTISGNVVSGNVYGIAVEGTGTADNVVIQNLVGVVVVGGTTSPVHNKYGVLLQGGATNNTVGGSSLAQANVIAGNTTSGVIVGNSGTIGNVIEFNYIGTDSSNDTGLGNPDGVLFFGDSGGGPTNNTIGPGDIISGNSSVGVYINNSGTSDNVVAGDLIGTNSAGAAALANGIGVVITGAASGNTIGGTTAADANVISGNTVAGVRIGGHTTTGNVVAGNIIGTDSSGTIAIPNAGPGVQLRAEAPGNTIGGTASGAGNLISGNTGDGVLVIDGYQDFVQGNRIGINADGTSAIANGGWGISVEYHLPAQTSHGGYTSAGPGSHTGSNVIGGSGTGAGNVVSGNSGGGIYLSQGVMDVVAGNLVGTNAAGTAALPNTLDGIDSVNGTGNTIGGTVAGARNVVASNESNNIEIDSDTADVVAGNYIGTDVTGTVALGGGDGVQLNGGISDTIGGTVSGAGNLISGNTSSGVEISGNTSTDNVIAGNLIGTDVTGTVALPNTFGVTIDLGASNNTIGGVGGFSANVISGNTLYGIYFTGTGATANVIEGNLIGTNLAGTTALGNYYGIDFNGNSGNTIGGTTAGAGNVISGNTISGIIVQGASEVIVGNLIGTDYTGTVAIGNSDGVDLYSADNTVGGTATGSGNVISGNVVGIAIAGADDNLVEGNLIGTDITGTVALGNQEAGMIVAGGATGNTIGGAASGAGNLISGNVGDGIAIDGSSTMDNLVQGNKIGTNLAGTAAVPNTVVGVDIYLGPTANTIGGTAAGARNLISGNTLDGVDIGGTGASDNVVLGNFIGTDVTGTVAIANGGTGVSIFGGGTANTIGGLTATAGTGAGNVISGNTSDGIEIAGAPSSDNVVAGNLIGTDETGENALSNRTSGVEVAGVGTTIGGTASGSLNVISSNRDSNILLDGSGATNVLVVGNNVGLDLAGTVSLSSSTGYGIQIQSSGNTIGGTLGAASRNVISGVSNGAVYLLGSSATGNLVQGNYIGTNVAGTAVIAYGVFGIEESQGAGSNTIGGTVAGAGNLIDGDVPPATFAIDVLSNDLVAGNLIDSNPGGTAVLGELSSAIRVGGSHNTIGGTVAPARNILPTDAIWIQAGAQYNLVEGNISGLDITGTIKLSSSSGIDVDGANNTIGGTVSGSANVLAGLSTTGEDGEIELNGTDNLIEGTLVGTDITGTVGIASYRGINIGFGATGNTVGGTTPAAANVLASSGYGLLIDGSSPGNLVEGNKIGTDITGTVSLPNLRGVLVASANNTIGGSTTGAGNLISGNVGNGLNGSDPNTGWGLWIDGGGATGNLVEGNLIGTDYTGEHILANSTNAGIYVDDTTGNTIGGSAGGAGNVVSGNYRGIFLTGSNDNLVQGNTIGTNLAGTIALANQAAGIYILNSASNTVGGSSAGAGNLISGNAGDGIDIYNALSTANVVEGNLIGTNAAGTLAIANQADGIDINSSGNWVGVNTVGGASESPLQRNVISGNTDNGIELGGAGATGNTVAGNFIGTDITGTLAIPNSSGVELDTSASGNTIGGLTSTPGTGAGNVISGNSSFGVYLVSASTGNVFAGNLVGTTEAGNAALANYAGFYIGAGTYNTIGGTTASAGNVISGNQRGIVSSDRYDLIAANLIGTTISGDSALPNSGDGVDLYAANCTIGGTAAGAGNVISGNGGDGLVVTQPFDLIEGNLIGTDKTGTFAIGNGSLGLWTVAYAGADTIGGTVAGAGNVISGNGGGIEIDAGSNVIQGNKIGTNEAGTAAITNTGYGIGIRTSDNTIGGTTAAARNLISGDYTGLSFYYAGGNLIEGNWIGTDVTGTVALGNGYGIELRGDATTSNTIGGSAAGAGNVISGNTYYGITDYATGDVIAGNLIGTTAAGNAPLRNGNAGVLLQGGPATVGGLTSTPGTGLGNVISGNGIGIWIIGTDELIEGNLIGTDPTGQVAVPNGDGIFVRGTDNTIGGTASGAGNVLSGNSNGVVIGVAGTADNVVQGNLIGTSITGDAALPNTGDGVLIAYSATSNTIGGTAAGSANVISGNSGGTGVEISGPGVTDNVVAGNLIGTDSTGEVAIPNYVGVMIDSGASGSTIGGLTTTPGTGSGNIISGNTDINVQVGILAGDPTTTDNVIAGNVIGTDAEGAVGLGSFYGIWATGVGTTIGGTATGALNLISGSIDGNVVITGVAATNDLIAGNYIGLNLTGTATTGDASGNITIDSSGNTIGGTSAAARNVIAMPSGIEINLNYSGSTGNLIQGNYIGVDLTDSTALATGTIGIQEENGAEGNTIGGTLAGAANVIVAGSGSAAIILNSDTLVQGNLIDSNPTGTAVVGQTTYGIIVETTAADLVDTGNTIGGTAAGAGNILTNDGIWLQHGAVNNLVEGNISGLDITGTVKLTTGNEGIEVDGPNNTIGGTASGAANVLAGSATDALSLSGPSSTGNLVEGNLIGTDSSGTVSIRNGDDGVDVSGGATDNTIGGTTTAAANVISDNSIGVYIDAASSANLIEGNKIGTDITGTVSLYNVNGMLIVGASNTIGGTAAGAGNIISGNIGYGGGDPNTGWGLWLDGPAATENVVEGNLIGLDATGEHILGNTTNAGIFIDGATDNTIGGTSADAANVISGNLRGIDISEAGATGNIIEGNLIGTDQTGSVALGNTGEGIIVAYAQANTIGGSAVGAGNVISGNVYGINILDGATDIVVQGNLIGLSSSGSAALGNSIDGIVLQGGTTGDTIGGTTAIPGTGAGNVISGNADDGIEITNTGTTANVVEGNLIGTDTTGTVAIANANGIFIHSGASSNTIGGTAAGAGNVISGNTNGVDMEITGTAANVVVGNFIGTDITGADPLGNVTGVVIGAGSLQNTVGGSVAGSRNVISGNLDDAIDITGATDNVVLGNMIGPDAAGGGTVRNGADGVNISNGGTGNTIGGVTATPGTGAGNVISENAIGIYDAAGSNLIAGNLIGTNAVDTGPLANLGDGIDLLAGGDTIGGTTAGAGNVISGNSDGIEINAGSSVVEGNKVGTNAAGTLKIGNTGVGIGISSPDNTIGGTSAAAANLISGNYYGINISYAGGTVVEGNRVGTDASGTVAVANAFGIALTGDASTSNTIGGTGSAGNLISGNYVDGISEFGTGDLIAGNFIGTTASGNAALGNGRYGITIGGSDDTVGAITATPGTGLGNVISGNSTGILVFGTGDLIVGNLIGTDPSGDHTVPNGDGILAGGTDDTIGGTASGAVNVISGNSGDGIFISGPYTTGNVVEGNVIGTDVTGSVAIANGAAGVLLRGRVIGNTIGGTAAGAGNLISGNIGLGVQILDIAAIRNLVAGNKIGTDSTGGVAIPNVGGGVAVEFGASYNTIGGSAAGAGNLVSGNAAAGVELLGTFDNVVQGNRIGTNESGTSALSNAYTGLLVRDGATASSQSGSILGSGTHTGHNLIGGSGAGAGNLVSGNKTGGIYLASGVMDVVAGNLVGTNAAGTAALPNQSDGINIHGGTGITIGGTASGAGNVISGNVGDNIDINNDLQVQVAGNKIGTNSAGTAGLANGLSGVAVGDSRGINVGGTTAGAGNLISGNTLDGVLIAGPGSTGILVAGNLIGTNASGGGAVPNGGGVAVESGASHITIGGSAAGAGNLISGNTGTGVELLDTFDNVVQGNRIGTNESGTSALSNAYTGILVSDGSSGAGSGSGSGSSGTHIGHNLIGGSGAGAGNLVSGNKTGGIYLATGVMDVVAGNLVGTNAAGTAVLPNQSDGIKSVGGTGIVIGGLAAGAGNLISGNSGDGVEIEGSGEVVAGNMIGTDITGTVALPNAIFGVVVSGGSNTIGGTFAAAQNLISGNMSAGIQISSSTATDNVVEGNRIGTTLDGAAALGNGAGPGVVVEYFATGNTIGGTTAGSANVISGNAGRGVIIYGHGTVENVVAGNLIGTNQDGTLAVAGESGAGVEIYGGAAQNTVGGSASGAGNLISGNEGDGVQINDGYQDFVQGNRIGLDRSGTGALANTAYGISLSQHFPAQTTSGYTSSGPGSHTGSNVIGGTGSGAQNVVSGNGAGGIFITSGIMDVVAGNYVGVNPTGGVAIPNGGAGVETQDSTANTIGGTAAGAGNLISGNSGSGILVLNDSAMVVQGNLVGTDFNGSSPIPNSGSAGLEVSQSESNTIGGTTPGATNLFSGNDGDGVIVEGSGSTGNLISGNQMVHDLTGVLIENSASQNTIGGTTAGSGNIIVLNQGDGIEVGSSATDTTIDDALLGNSIYANNGLGIDLGSDGVTLNDSSGHTGPNLFQDFPVLSSVFTTDGVTHIQGTISAAPSTEYYLEFFSNPTSDPSGYGQGQTFLTSTTVTTGSDGSGAFLVPTPSPLTVGESVSSTATDPSGNTSEFSADSIAIQSNTVYWVNSSGGDWDTPGNWSDDAVPTGADDVVINIAVSSPITHNSSYADAVNSLTSSDPITIGVGSLAIGTTAQLSASLTLQGGTIDGGTIELSGGATLIATSYGGTLAGVSIDGTLDMSASFALITVTGGLTIDGTILMGNQAGTTNGILSFVGAQTLAGTGEIVFGTSGFNQINTASSGGSDTGTLTIGAGITIDGASGFIGYDGGVSQTPLVIEGTVDAQTGGDDIQIFGTGWTSSGTLEASGGALVVSGTNFTSTGTISASSGFVEVVGTWTDNGVISAGSSSVVDLYGTFSVGSNASFSGSGTVDINGTVDNSGGTISLDNSGTVVALTGGEIDGGDIVTTNGAALFVASSGTLADGVTLDGTLDMATFNSSLTVTDGLTLGNGSILIGNGAGSIYCDLTFQGAQTLGGTGTIVFGGGNRFDNRLDTASSGGDSGTLTIGSGITIEGQSGSIEPNSGGAYPLILQGTIDDNVSGGEIQVDGTNWSNLGTITATSGGSVVTGGTWTDNGIVSADSTSTVNLGGTFSVGSSASFTGTGTVAVTGTLDNSGSALTLDDSALTFEMGGGEIDGGDIVTTNGAALFGSGFGGTLAGVTLDGTLDMATFNSSLTVTDGLTLGNGSILIGNGAGSIYTDLTFQGAQTLGGTGTIVFGGGNRYYNRLDTASSGGDSGTLTIGSGITIEGQSGSIEPNSGGAFPLILQGTIDDNMSGGQIQVDATNWSNLGTITATSGGSVLAEGTWTDNSVVSADATSTVYLAGTFSVGSSASFTGTGTVAVSGTLDNSGSTLTLDDSALTFDTVNGGEIDGGDIVTTNGAALFASGGTLAGVTLDGTLNMATFNSSLTVTDGLTLGNGSILIGNGAGSYGDLSFEGAQTLGGTGTIVFGGSSAYNNRIDTASSGGDSGTLTIGSGITIEGQNGFIGLDGGGTEYPMILEGTIDDNVSGGQIQVLGSRWSNSGTITATSGGSVFAGGTWTDNSVVSADSTSTVYLGGTFSVGSSASFTGTGAVAVAGTLDNSGTSLTLDDPAVTFEMGGGEIEGGDIVTTNGAALFGTGGTLAGVTLDGTLDMATYSSVLAVTGGLTLSNGSILIGNGAGSSGDLTFQGAQTLGGTGTVIFGGSSAYNNRLDTASSGGDSGTLTIGTGITIEGQNGFIGLDGGGTEYPMVLEGTIDDNVSGGQIQVLGSNWSNSGTITATSGGSVFAQGTWTDNSVVSADSTSTVYLGGTFSVGSSASFTGTGTVEVAGTLDNSGSTLTLDDSALTFETVNGGEIDGGDIVTTNGAALFASGGTLAGVTLDGTLDLATNNSLVSVTGGLTLSHGSILIGNGAGSTYGNLIFQGAQTFGGTGTVVFGSSLNNDQIFNTSSGGDSGTLTIGAGITIEGQSGYVGFNNGGTEYPLILQGTVDANVSGGLIEVLGSNWSNQGTITATSGGSVVTGGTWTDNSVVSADSTSTVGLGGTFSVGSSASFTGTGTVEVTGTLDNSGSTLTLDDSALTFEMGGGEIGGGDIVTTNGAALFGSDVLGTLAGVTLDATLDLATNDSVVAVTGGLTLSNGSILIGNGAGSTYGNLIFQGAQTFGGTGTVVFGSSLNNDQIFNTSSGGDSGTLTIGSGIIIEGQSGYVGFNNGGTEYPLILRGTVDANVSGGLIEVLGSNWSNSGTLEASAAGSQLDLSGTNWTSSGLISATSGSSVAAIGTWTDDGVISADSTSTVDLGGTFSVDSGSSFAGTGAVDIAGTLDNSGQTLTLNDPELSFGVAGGTIDGGTVETTGGAALFATNSGGTLDGVTLDGTLDLTGYYPLLDVTGGLTLDNGTIDIGTLVGGAWGMLIFQGAQTLGGSGSIVFGGIGSSRIDTESSGGDSGILTIGPDVTIGGDDGSIGYNDNNSEIETPIVIQGTVDADTSGGAINIYGTNWTNSGTIEATNGGVAQLFGTWTDDGVISADSSSVVYLEGTFSVDPGSSFAGTGAVDIAGTLDNSGQTLTLNDSKLSFGVAGGTIDGGTVETTGGAALFATGYGGTLDGVTLDGTLDMTGQYAALDVTGGLTLDNGTIDLGTAVGGAHRAAHIPGRTDPGRLRLDRLWLQRQQRDRHRIQWRRLRHPHDWPQRHRRRGLRLHRVQQR